MGGANGGCGVEEAEVDAGPGCPGIGTERRGERRIGAALGGVQLAVDATSRVGDTERGLFAKGTLVTARHGVGAVMTWGLCATCASLKDQRSRALAGGTWISRCSCPGEELAKADVLTVRVHAALTKRAGPPTGTGLGAGADAMERGVVV